MKCSKGDHPNGYFFVGYAISLLHTEVFIGGLDGGSFQTQQFKLGNIWKYSVLTQVTQVASWKWTPSLEDMDSFPGGYGLLPWRAKNSQIPSVDQAPTDH